MSVALPIGTESVPVSTDTLCWLLESDTICDSADYDDYHRSSSCQILTATLTVKTLSVSIISLIHDSVDINNQHS